MLVDELYSISLLSSAESSGFLVVYTRIVASYRSCVGWLIVD